MTKDKNILEIIPKDRLIIKLQNRFLIILNNI